MTGASGSPWAAFEAKSWTAHLEEFPLPGSTKTAEYDTPKLGTDGKALKDAKGNVITEKKRGRERMPIEFRESGDASALVDLVFGQATGADKNRAMSALVVSSVNNPPMSEADFNAMSLQCKLALFTEIMSHVKKDAAVDFPDGAPVSVKNITEPKTAVGGPGGRQKSSATVTPLEP